MENALIERRKDLGVEVLDKYFGQVWPDGGGRTMWRSRVNVDRLNLRCGSKCVVGQALGGYSLGIELLMRFELGADAYPQGSCAWAIEHGFLASAGHALPQGSCSWAIQHGFLAPSGEALGLGSNSRSILRYWVELQQAWTRELEPA